MQLKIPLFDLSLIEHISVDFHIVCKHELVKLNMWLQQVQLLHLFYLLLFNRREKKDQETYLFKRL